MQQAGGEVPAYGDKTGSDPDSVSSLKWAPQPLQYTGFQVQFFHRHSLHPLEWFRFSHEYNFILYIVYYLHKWV